MGDADWRPVVYLGFSLAIVGLLIFALSGTNFQWLIDHGYLYNAPSMSLIVFLLIGSILVAGGLRWKRKIETISANPAATLPPTVDN
jgi:F0F1-type ATP synthase assembly protein I